MFFSSSKGISDNQNFSLGELSNSEVVIYWTTVLTPLWWLLGIQPLFYPVLVALLLVAVFQIDKLIRVPLPAFSWMWLAMALIMLWTAILGIDSVGFSLTLAASSFVTFLKSYFLIFAGITLPFWSKIRVSVITRAVTWLSISFIIIILIQMILLAAGVDDQVYLPPLGRMVPGNTQSLEVRSAKISPFFGIPLPRTLLHTADPPILGVCALICFFICLGETNQHLRKWGIVGALCALILSFSRSAWICFVLDLAIIASFSNQITRQLSLWFVSLVSLLCSFLEMTFQELLDAPLAIFDSARADSSSTRELVVQKTIEAWRDMPWLGWGIIRGKVWLYEDEYLALSSFSTYAAVLYLNGIVGFVIFIAALLLTLVAFCKPAIQGNVLCQRAFAILVTLLILIQATPLSWMAVYLWFFFIWLGAIFCELEANEKPVTRWEDLSKFN